MNTNNLKKHLLNCGVYMPAIFKFRNRFVFTLFTYFVLGLKQKVDKAFRKTCTNEYKLQNVEFYHILKRVYKNISPAVVHAGFLSRE